MMIKTSHFYFYYSNMLEIGSDKEGSVFKVTH